MEEPLPTLIVVRHAESVHHVTGLTGGWTDTGLTELGQRQAGLLAARLRGELGRQPLRILSSDLQRARQTADPIGRALGRSIELVPALRELDNGAAAGMTQEQARGIAVEPSPPLLDWQPYPGAETWRRFYARVVGFMEQLIQEEPRPALLVTHGGTIVNIVSWWLGLPLEQLHRYSFDVAPASLTVLRVDPWDQNTIERLNDTAHLYAAGLAVPMQL